MAKNVISDLKRATLNQTGVSVSPRKMNFRQQIIHHNLGYSSLYFNKLLVGGNQVAPKMGVYSHLKYAQHQFQQAQFGMDLMKDVITTKNIKLNMKSKGQVTKNTRGHPVGTGHLSPNQDPLICNMKSVEEMQELRDKELQMSLQELINNKSQQDKINRQQLNNQDLSSSLQVDGNGKVMSQNAKKQIATTLFQFQGAANHQQTTGNKSKIARNKGAANNTAQMHTEVFTGSMGHTLKKIEKSFDNENQRVIHGSKTTSNNGNIESINDNTLNESPKSLHRNNPDKILLGNPLDAGFEVVKQDEDDVVEDKGVTQDDRQSGRGEKAAENTSQYSKHINGKYSAGPTKWEIHQKSDSTHHNDSRSPQGSAEFNENDRKRPKQLLEQLRIQDNQETHGGTGQNKTKVESHLKIRDFAQKQIEEQVDKIIKKQRRDSQNKNLQGDLPVKIPKINMTQKLPLIDTQAGTLKRIQDESHSEDKTPHQEYLDSKLPKKQPESPAFMDQAQQVSFCQQTQGFSFNNTQHNQFHNQDGTLATDPSQQLKGSLTKLPMVADSSVVVNGLLVDNQQPNLRNLRTKKTSKMKVVHSPNILNINQLVMQKESKRASKNNTVLATLQDKRLERVSPGNQHSNAKQPFKLTAFDFENLSTQKYRKQKLHHHQQHQYPAYMVSVVNRNSNLNNQSPNLRRFADKMREANSKDIAAYLTNKNKQISAVSKNYRTLNNSPGVDLVRDVERVNEKLVGTPLFFNKHKKHLTITKKVPQLALMERNSISTYSNNYREALKPTMNATHMGNVSVTKTQDQVSDHGGQSSYYAQFSPTGFDKMQRTGIMLPTLDSLSPVKTHNKTMQSNFNAIQIQEVEVQQSDEREQKSIKAGEGIIQAVEEIMTSSKAFKLVQSPSNSTKKKHNSFKKKRAEDQSPKKQNFHININNVELHHQSSDQIGNNLKSQEFVHSVKSAQSANSAENKGNESPSKGLGRWHESKQLRGKQFKQAKGNNYSGIRDREGLNRSSEAELQIKQKDPRDAAKNEANSRMESLKQDSEVKRASIINLNEFIQTTKQSRVEEGATSGVNSPTRLMTHPFKIEHGNRSGSHAQIPNKGLHITINETKQRDHGSIESDVISVVELIDLDPKISNVRHVSQPKKKKVQLIRNNHDLDSIIKSSVRLANATESKDMIDNQHQLIQGDLKNLNLSHQPSGTFPNNTFVKKQEQLREKHLSSQLGKYGSPQQSKDTLTLVKAFKNAAGKKQKDPDGGQKIQIQVPYNLDKRALNYQFTSSNRSNHLTNFNARQQHHTIEMKVDAAKEEVSKLSYLGKNLTLKANELIDILQNVHVRPKPLTNKVGSHYRSRSSLITNYFPKQQSNDILQFSAKNGNDGLQLTQQQAFQTIGAPDQLKTEVDMDGEIIQLKERQNGLIFMQQYNVKKLIVQPPQKEKQQGPDGAKADFPFSSKKNKKRSVAQQQYHTVATNLPMTSNATTSREDGHPGRVDITAFGHTTEKTNEGPVIIENENTPKKMSLQQKHQNFNELSYSQDLQETQFDPMYSPQSMHRHKEDQVHTSSQTAAQHVAVQASYGGHGPLNFDDSFLTKLVNNPHKIELRKGPGSLVRVQVDDQDIDWNSTNNKQPPIFAHNPTLTHKVKKQKNKYTEVSGRDYSHSQNLSQRRDSEDRTTQVNKSFANQAGSAMTHFRPQDNKNVLDLCIANELQHLHNLAATSKNPNAFNTSNFWLGGLEQNNKPLPPASQKQPHSPKKVNIFTQNSPNSSLHQHIPSQSPPLSLTNHIPATLSPRAANHPSKSILSPTGRLQPHHILQAQALATGSGPFGHKQLISSKAEGIVRLVLEQEQREDGGGRGIGEGAWGLNQRN